MAEFADAAQPTAEALLQKQKQQIADRVSGMAEALECAAHSLDCRRKIEMSLGAQSRDDTPVGGRDDQRDTASEPNAGWGLSDYCR